VFENILLLRLLVIVFMTNIAFCLLCRKDKRGVTYQQQASTHR